jgi:hypothetical protein
MRSSGTSLLIHSSSGLRRDTRLPVLGSLMNRARSKRGGQYGAHCWDAVAAAGMAVDGCITPHPAETHAYPH